MPEPPQGVALTPDTPSQTPTDLHAGGEMGIEGGFGQSNGSDTGPGLSMLYGKKAISQRRDGLHVPVNEVIALCPGHGAGKEAHDLRVSAHFNKSGSVRVSPWAKTESRGVNQLHGRSLCPLGPRPLDPAPKNKISGANAPMAAVPRRWSTHQLTGL